MSALWHCLELNGAVGNRLEARGLVPASSGWFEGHFPQAPIVPGIALISMAFEAVRQNELQQGRVVRLQSVRRVRFKKPVLPDQRFIITLMRESRDKAGDYVFMVELEDEAACTGILALAYSDRDLTCKEHHG